MKYLAKKPMCRRIMALMFALVMVAANLLGTGITANAGATNSALSEPEYYDKGTLKSLTATFGWSTDAEVTGRLVLMSKQLSGGEYPDNLIMVINVANGVVQYTPAIGRNSYDDSLFTTVVNESENRYKVTVRPTLIAPMQRSVDLEDRRFSYAYDVQRSPAFPIKGQTIIATGLSKPYISIGNSVESSGNWTLTKIGTYSVIKNSDKNSDNLQGIIENISMEYQDITSDNIVIHELKEGNRHIAYGVTLAYDSVNGIAVFIGDALSRGAGYLLSAKEETGMISIVANMDVTDWVPPTTYKITVVSTENGTTRTSISETIVGDQVTIYASADANYEVESVIYNDGQDHIVSLIDGKYVFVMPEKDVTVKATYKYVSTDDEVSDGNEEKEPEVILPERTNDEAPTDKKVTDNTPVDTGDHSQMTAWLYVFILRV